MGSFFSDNLETIMMVAFLVAVALSMYKVYVIFEKKAEQDGVNLASMEEEVIRVFHELFEEIKDFDEKAICEKIKAHEAIAPFKNFNQNRFRLIMQQLFDEHKVENLEELIHKLKNQDK